MHTLKCMNCNEEFQAKRRDAKTCSQNCRAALMEKEATDNQETTDKPTDNAKTASTDNLSVEKEAIQPTDKTDNSPDPYTMPIPDDEPNFRKDIIEAIRNGKSGGTLEYWPSNPEYGIIIRRTAEEARVYERLINKEKVAAIEQSKAYEAKRALVSKHKGRIPVNP